MKTLYFAYGSNLNMYQFLARCPDAEPVAAAQLKGWRLVFAGGGHADVVKGKKSDVVHGAVYWCTPTCMRALDRYEGVKGGYYERKSVDVNIGGIGRVRAVMYVMLPERGAYQRPSESYLHTIIEGLRHWRLSGKMAAAIRREVRRAKRDEIPVG